jgi:hypothetical protein
LHPRAKVVDVTRGSFEKTIHGDSPDSLMDIADLVTDSCFFSAFRCENEVIRPKGQFGVL